MKKPLLHYKQEDKVEAWRTGYLGIDKLAKLNTYLLELLCISRCTYLEYAEINIVSKQSYDL